MSVRILHSFGENKSALYDSVTGHAFGPVIDGPEDLADKFIKYVKDTIGDDIRVCSDDELDSHYAMFSRQTPAWYRFYYKGGYGR